MARHQLGTALDLFIRDRDPIAIQCLACGGAEVIEELAKQNNVEPFSTHILQTIPDLDMKTVKSLQRQYWNAFKHATSHAGKQLEDEEILSSFDDTKNDVALFIGWWDYLALTRKLPVEAQVFQIWWYEDKVIPEADLSAIRDAFPNIRGDCRDEQKRRLRRSVEKWRANKNLLADARTEQATLCVRANVFVRPVSPVE